MRMPQKRRVKIVATLGPASSSREIIREMIRAGMNVARLNFSHGSHEDHTTLFEIVREESTKLDRHVAIVQDLCGPKVRISQFPDGQIELKEGQKLELRYDPEGKTNGSEKSLFVEAFNPATVIRSGEKALLADGRIVLLAEKNHADYVECTVLSGGPLRSRSGIIVPDSRLDLPVLTEKDKHDLTWAMSHDIDYIALSFVQSHKDISNARVLMDTLGKQVPIIAKIERAQSLDHLSAIVESSDAVMVARGDLGLELPLERVPSAQRLIISTSNYAGTPVITATQMLMSMVREVRPTRAEVSDVSTAVRDGTDAVMLSDETAIGHHPVLSIETLSRIIEEAERELNYEWDRPPTKRSDRARVADAVCYAACNAADKISPAAIVACTESGYTARLLSKYRPQQLLFAATSTPSALTRMALYWGIEPVFIELPPESDMEDEVVEAMNAIRDQFGIKPGSRVVATVGLRARKSGSTNVMEIREVPRN